MNELEVALSNARKNGMTEETRELVTKTAEAMLRETIILPFSNPSGMFEAAVLKEALAILETEQQNGLNDRLNRLLFRDMDATGFKHELQGLRAKILSGKAFRTFWTKHCRMVNGQSYNNLINARYYSDGVWVYEGGWYGAAPKPTF